MHWRTQSQSIIALDTGEATSIDDAMRIFAGYQVQLVLGPEVAESAALQAAVLTAANCATRTLLGGVTVVGGHVPLRVMLPPFGELKDVLRAFGATIAEVPTAGIPTVLFGSSSPDGIDRLAIRVVVRGWSGGIAPATQTLAHDGAAAITTAGVAAGALAVAEVF